MPREEERSKKRKKGAVAFCVKVSYQKVSSRYSGGGREAPGIGEKKRHRAVSREVGQRPFQKAEKKLERILSLCERNEIRSGKKKRWCGSCREESAMLYLPFSSLEKGGTAMRCSAKGRKTAPAEERGGE